MSALAAGADRRRPPARPERSPSRWPRSAERPGYPILAEPTSQLRLGGHDRELRRLALRRDRPPAPAGARARARDPLRRHADQQGAAPVARVAPRAAPGGRRPGVRLERALQPRRRRSCAPSPRCAGRGLAERLAAARHELAGRLAGRRAAGRRRRSQAELDAARASRPSPALHAALARLYARRRPRLHGLLDADPRPGGVRAVRRNAGVEFLCNRGANGIDGLISSGIGAAAASGRPDVDRDRRPRPATTT